MVARSVRQVCKSAVCAARNGKYTKAVARSDVRYGDAQQRAAGRARGQGISAVSFLNYVVKTTEFDLQCAKIHLLCGKPHTAAAKMWLCAVRRHDELTGQRRYTAARQLHKRCAVRGWFCGISHLFQKAVSCASGDSRTFIAKPCLYRRTAPFPQNRIFPASRTFPLSRTFSANRAFSANHTFPRAAPFREKESSSLIAGMPFFLPPSLTPGGGGDIINYSSGANRLFGGML